MLFRQPASWARVSLLFLVRFPDPYEASVTKNCIKLKKEGVRGYELAIKCDPFWGQNNPEQSEIKGFLDSMGNRDGRSTIEDWLEIGLPKEHFDYFDSDKNGKLNGDELQTWFMQKRPAQTMNLSEVENPPLGHRSKLFSWKKSLPSDDLVYRKPYPHPREFWKKHMDGYLPAILKGAQAGWPAMGWTKEVLMEKFGWVDAKLEPKIESRQNNTGFIELDRIAPRHRLNLSEYLRIEEGKNMYVVSIIPQEMAWGVAHPSVMLCGSRRKMLNKRSKPPYKVVDHEYPSEFNYNWMTHVFEANLWMGTGRTRSQLHYDKEWNVNCLLSGTKKWIFVDPFKYDKTMPWARGKKFKPMNPLNNAWTDWVWLNPDSVDLIVQHKLRDYDYYELLQEAGDCILIPYAMLHQVEKLDEQMQVAASWMFLPETIYDEDDCADAPLSEDLPLAAMDTMYAYTGKGIIPQGYADPLNFINSLHQMMSRKRATHLSLEVFTQAVSQGEAILKGKKKRIKTLFQLLSSYGKDSKKGLHIDELRQIPLRVWCKPACEGDEEGPLPCDDGEEYNILDDKEFARMKKYIEGVHAKGTSASKPSPGFKPCNHSRIPKYDVAGKTDREEL